MSRSEIPADGPLRRCASGTAPARAGGAIPDEKRAHRPDIPRGARHCSNRREMRDQQSARDLDPRRREVVSSAYYARLAAVAMMNHGLNRDNHRELARWTERRGRAQLHRARRAGHRRRPPTCRYVSATMADTGPTGTTDGAPTVAAVADQRRDLAHQERRRPRPARSVTPWTSSR